jgi:alpha-glucosidase
LAVFARRKGKEWFLGVLNGSTPKNIKVPLSFLGRGKYNAMLVRDKMDDAAAERTETATLGSTDSLSIEMRPGGGFVARFVPSTINGRV